MTDGHLMDADCIHGVAWYECQECAKDDPAPPPFPEREHYGCVNCGSINHTTGDKDWCPVERGEHPAAPPSGEARGVPSDPQREPAAPIVCVHGFERWSCSRCIVLEGESGPDDPGFRRTRLNGARRRRGEHDAE